MSETLDIVRGDQQLSVEVRRHKAARSVKLRVSRVGGQAIVTAPPRVSLKKIKSFIEANTDWIDREQSRAAPRKFIVDGQYIPVLGINHMVSHNPLRSRGVRCEDGVIDVAGDAGLVPVRLARYLKEQAKKAARTQVQACCDQLGVTFRSLTLTDTRSRWGSCSAKGHLRLNWRLVLAPRAVFDYVVAHEVAHLIEMNHSPAFWAQVAKIDSDWKTHRKWLKDHGSTLQAWCFEAR